LNICTRCSISSRVRPEKLRGVRVADSPPFANALSALRLVVGASTAAGVVDDSLLLLIGLPCWTAVGCSLLSRSSLANFTD
jgi:hypothetical protein